MRYNPAKPPYGAYKCDQSPFFIDEYPRLFSSITDVTDVTEMTDRMDMTDDTGVTDGI